MLKSGMDRRSYFEAEAEAFYLEFFLDFQKKNNIEIGTKLTELEINIKL